LVQKNIKWEQKEIDKKIGQIFWFR
jgi:hypothetical protein